MNITNTAGDHTRHMSPADVVPTCPLCHTAEATMTTPLLLEGGHWRCTRCGQMWDAERLQTAADYARYAAARN